MVKLMNRSMIISPIAIFQCFKHSYKSKQIIGNKSGLPKRGFLNTLAQPLELFELVNFTLEELSVLLANNVA